MPESAAVDAAAVADATVLIYLAKLDRLADRWDRFDRVLVPPPVQVEVVREGKRLEHPDAIRVEQALDRGDLELADPVEIPSALEDVGLEHGDQAVLAHALAEGIPTVLTDDSGVRGVARAHGLTPRGTLAFLVEALREGELSFDGYLAELEALAAAGFRLSAELYARAVRRGREITGEGSRGRD